MSHQSSFSPIENGFNYFQGMRPEVIECVENDMLTDPTTVKSVFTDLTLANPSITMAVLELASDEGEKGSHPENATIRGAELIIRLIAHHEWTQSVTTMYEASGNPSSVLDLVPVFLEPVPLAELTFSGDGDALDQQPAA